MGLDFDSCRCDRLHCWTDGRLIVSVNVFWCVDMDECAMFADVCKGGGVCVNTPGSFHCLCPPGMTLDYTGMTCTGNI